MDQTIYAQAALLESSIHTALSCNISAVDRFCGRNRRGRVMVALMARLRWRLVGRLCCESVRVRKHYLKGEDMEEK